MKSCKKLLTRLVVLILPICFIPAMIAPKAVARSQNYTRQTTRRVDTTSPVAGIAREVRHELLTLPYYNVFDWIEYEVKSDGSVVLRGKVVSPPDTKSRAEKAVKDVEGVTNVINRIEVLPASPSDDRLREALYYTIYSGPLFRYGIGSLHTIHILVENGHVTLKGMVDSQLDKQLAETRARTVFGVFDVKNDLQIRNKES